MGIGHRCRFYGNVFKDFFDELLLVSDFVVIPARTWQDDNLARLAIANGKPVLTTHQSGIHCVSHGENGLVTYDNTNSIIWGLNELLSNPLQGSMLRLVAHHSDEDIPSDEKTAVKHYIEYERMLRNDK